MNYNFLEIKKKLKKYIQKGNTIYIESDIFELLKYSKVKNIKIKVVLNQFLSLLKQLIGVNGIIICPSFSYSWALNKKNNIFDVKKTKAKTGIFAEFLRIGKNSFRTEDPIFSFTIYGKKKKNFLDLSNDSFGKNSLFDKINNENTWLISFLVKKFDPTFVHYVEQYFDENIKKIKYRKKFKLTGMINDYYNNNKKKTYYTFLRPDNKYIYNENKIKKILSRKKLLKSIKFKNNTIFLVKANNFFKTGIEQMKLNNKFFVKKNK